MKCQEILGKIIVSVASEYNIDHSLQEACDWGRLIELYLSHIIFNTPTASIRSWQYHLKELYGETKIECKWYPKIWALVSNNIQNSCYLELPNSENVYTAQTIDKKELIEAFDFCREGF